MATQPEPDRIDQLLAQVARRASRRPHPLVPDLAFLFVIGKLAAFWLVVKDGSAGVTRHRPATTDTTITIDSLDTAEAVVTDRISPLRAFLAGRISATGNVRLAQTHLAELLGP